MNCFFYKTKPKKKPMCKAARVAGGNTFEENINYTFIYIIF